MGSNKSYILKTGSKRLDLLILPLLAHFSWPNRELIPDFKSLAGNSPLKIIFMNAFRKPTSMTYEKYSCQFSSLKDIMYKNGSVLSLTSVYVGFNVQMLQCIIIKEPATPLRSQFL